MRRVFVTGASGYLGQHLVEALQDTYDVVGGYASRPVSFSKAAAVRLDICDANACQRVLSEAAPHCVVHAAAMSQTADCEKDPDGAFAVNTAGTGAIVTACSAIDPPPHLVYISTDLVFDGRKGCYSEEDKPFPLQTYGVSKLMGEELAKLYRWRWTVLRSALIYGPPRPDRRCFLDWTLEGIRAGTFSFFEDEYRCPVYVADLCMAIASVIESRNRGLFHLGGPQRLSRLEFANLTSSIFFDNSPKLKSDKLAESDMAKLRPADVSMDISKARRELGYSPLPPEQALRRIRQEQQDSDILIPGILP